MSEVIRINILENFKNNLITFFQELIDLDINDGNDFQVVKGLLSANIVDIKDIMNYFCENLIPYKSMIEKKDDNFFLSNTNILFDGFDMKRVNYFKELWLSKKLNNENREVIWEWFRAFIVLSEKYKNLK